MGALPRTLVLSLVALSATSVDLAAADKLDWSLEDDDEIVYVPSDNGAFTLRGSLGAASIVAHEKVFVSASSNDLLSLLVWETTAPIASISAEAQLGGQWSLRGRFDTTLGGESRMADYDWLPSYYAGPAADQWTDRSLHPNTSLDWYLDGEIAIGTNFRSTDNFSAGASAGLRYTDVKWTAVGGSATYSVGGFRDTAVLFPDAPVIDFRMRLPTAFLGFDSTFTHGPWTLSGSSKVGTTFLAGQTDHHYLRNLRFEENLSMALAYSAEARLAYAFSEHVGMFVAGSYDRVVSGHIDSAMYDMTTGEQLHLDRGGAGGELQVASVKVGLQGSF